MIPITADKSSRIRDLEQKAERLRRRTKVVDLKGGPFHERTARIVSSYDHFATTVPESVAKHYPPLEFDGVPDMPEKLAFLAYYEEENVSKLFEFQRIRIYKQTDPKINLPLGYEEVKTQV